MTITAESMNWKRIERFTPGEWPPETLEFMDPSVIDALAEIRDQLPADHTMTPSPIPRAHVRHEDSGSRHATNFRARLADATDIFMEWRHVWPAWSAALATPRVGGLGIYTDMVWAGQASRKAMLHIDTRPDRVVWVAWRENAKAPMKYVYLHSDPIGFHRTISERARSK